MKILVGDVQRSGRDLALAARELAERLGVSLRKIRRMDKAGELPTPVRFGRSVRWPVAEVEHWLAAGAPDRKTWSVVKKSSQGRSTK
jgi:excisionase family DNA binding protein